MDAVRTFPVPEDAAGPRVPLGALGVHPTMASANSEMANRNGLTRFIRTRPFAVRCERTTVPPKNSRRSVLAAMAQADAAAPTQLALEPTRLPKRDVHHQRCLFSVTAPSRTRASI